MKRNKNFCLSGNDCIYLSISWELYSHFNKCKGSAAILHANYTACYSGSEQAILSIKKTCLYCFFSLSAEMWT